MEGRINIRIFTYKHLLFWEMFKTENQLSFLRQPEQRLVLSN